MTKKQHIDLLRAKVRNTHSSISVDGSAFDSTQYAELMRACDNIFWVKLRPYLVSCFLRSGFDRPEELASRVVKAA